MFSVLPIAQKFNTLTTYLILADNSKSKNANETTNSTILYDWKWKLNRLYEEVNEYWKGVTNQSYYTEQTPLLPKQNRSTLHRFNCVGLKSF